jgi:hypothetical protein
MTHGGELQVTSAPSSKSNSSMSESKTEHSHGISMGAKLGMTCQVRVGCGVGR